MDIFAQDKTTAVKEGYNDRVQCGDSVEIVVQYSSVDDSIPPISVVEE
jgi:hypothetical protein